MLYISFRCGLLLAAVAVTRRISPAAAGSGIPEMRAILEGFDLGPDLLSFKTLVTKVVGLVLALGAGVPWVRKDLSCTRAASWPINCYACALFGPSPAAQSCCTPYSLPGARRAWPLRLVHPSGRSLQHRGDRPVLFGKTTGRLSSAPCAGCYRSSSAIYYCPRKERDQVVLPHELRAHGFQPSRPHTVSSACRRVWRARGHLRQALSRHRAHAPHLDVA